MPLGSRETPPPKRSSASKTRSFGAGNRENHDSSAFYARGLASAPADPADALAEPADRRIGHPAPFPVALPKRFIELYTSRDDLVLDPFLGSGSTAVAAVEAGRHYAGYDTDPDYVHLAQTRVEAARNR